MVKEQSFYHRVTDPPKSVSLLKPFKELLLCLFIFGCPFASSGQDNPWFFGLHTYSNNVWTNDVLSIARAFVNIPVANAIGSDAPIDLNIIDVHYLSMKDNGENVDFKRNNPYGFKAYDLFNHLEFGAKVGWLGRVSPIGAYVYGAYGLNQYKLRFLGEREYSKHRMHSLRAGVGVRISPLYFLMKDYDWCPIFEVGTTYVYNFKYKGPNGSDVNQINNGMRTSYAAGVIFDEGAGSVMLCFDMSHYDIFNRQYTPDGGFWFPYANFKNNDMNFSLRVSLNLWDD